MSSKTLDYIHSCEELRQKGLYIELHSGVIESISAKWAEMFEVREEAVVAEINVKEPRRKRAAKPTLLKRMNHHL